MGRFLFLQVLKLGIQNCPDILSKFIQTSSYGGYKVLFSKIIIVLENKQKPTQMGRFLFYKFLILASKIDLTSSANSSKLVPKVATKPIKREAFV